MPYSQYNHGVPNFPIQDGSYIELPKPTPFYYTNPGGYDAIGKLTPEKIKKIMDHTGFDEHTTIALSRYVRSITQAEQQKMFALYETGDTAPLVQDLLVKEILEKGKFLDTNNINTIEQFNTFANNKREDLEASVRLSEGYGDSQRAEYYQAQLDELEAQAKPYLNLVYTMQTGKELPIESYLTQKDVDSINSTVGNMYEEGKKVTSEDERVALANLHIGSMRGDAPKEFYTKDATWTDTMKDGLRGALKIWDNARGVDSEATEQLRLANPFTFHESANIAKLLTKAGITPKANPYAPVNPLASLGRGVYDTYGDDIFYRVLGTKALSALGATTVGQAVTKLPITGPGIVAMNSVGVGLGLAPLIKYNFDAATARGVQLANQAVYNGDNERERGVNYGGLYSSKNMAKNAITAFTRGGMETVAAASIIGAGRTMKVPFLPPLAAANASAMTTGVAGEVIGAVGDIAKGLASDPNFLWHDQYASDTKEVLDNSIRYWNNKDAKSGVLNTNYLFINPEGHENKNVGLSYYQANPEQLEKDVQEFYANKKIVLPERLNPTPEEPKIYTSPIADKTTPLVKDITLPKARGLSKAQYLTGAGVGAGGALLSYLMSNKKESKTKRLLNAGLAGLGLGGATLGGMNLYNKYKS